MPPTNTAPATTARETYTPPANEAPVVVSFNGAENRTRRGHRPGSQATGKATAPDQGKSIRFHLENAPWEMVLNQFAKKAGLTLQILDIPPGSVTYTNDEKWYTPTEALDILHGYLLQKGFVMIKRDRFLVVLSIDKRPIPPNLIPNISIAELEDGDHGQHELLNVVLPLEGADANEAAREVEGLKGPQGNVVPLSVSNSLVVTDTYSNLQRIHGLLKGVTAKLDPEDLQFKSFPLKYVAAGEAEVIVRDQLGLGSGVTNVSPAPTISAARIFQRVSRPRGRVLPAPIPTANSTPEAKVTADPRTNSLLVTATKNQLAIAEQVLMTLDVSEDQIANPGMRNWACLT